MIPLSFRLHSKRFNGHLTVVALPAMLMFGCAFQRFFLVFFDSPFQCFSVFFPLTVIITISLEAEKNVLSKMPTYVWTKGSVSQ